MRIQVKSKDANLDIPLPTSMLVSPMVSRIVLKAVRKEGRDLSWLTPELVGIAENPEKLDTPERTFHAGGSGKRGRRNRKN